MTALFDEAFTRDPHPTYAALRRTEPVYRVELPGGVPIWLVTGYEEGRRALTDPRLSKAPGEAERNTPLPAEIYNALNQHMLTADPPDHTRLRRLVSGVFTARRIEALRPRVQQLADDLLDAIDGPEPVDIVGAYAFPLPIQVICELLGIPMDDRDAFRTWSNTIVAGTIVGGTDAAAAMPAAAAAMVAYIQDLLKRKRNSPDERLLSAMLAAGEDGDQLSPDELVSTVFLLLVAGHETSSNLIGNSVHTVLARPDLHRRLLAEPDLLPSAIEEVLRFESPLQTTTMRVATTAMTIGGKHIAAGEPVLVSLLSANRDPDRFAEPDTFDPARPDNQHLAFGHGIHYCLGAPLARIEAHVALGRLLHRFPDLRPAVPAEDLVWRPGLLLRGLSALPVHLKGGE